MWVPCLGRRVRIGEEEWKRLAERLLVTRVKGCLKLRCDGRDCIRRRKSATEGWGEGYAVHWFALLGRRTRG